MSSPRIPSPRLPSPRLTPPHPVSPHPASGEINEILFNPESNFVNCMKFILYQLMRNYHLTFQLLQEDKRNPAPQKKMMDILYTLQYYLRFICILTVNCALPNS